MTNPTTITELVPEVHEGKHRYEVEQSATRTITIAEQEMKKPECGNEVILPTK